MLWTLLFMELFILRLVFFDAILELMYHWGWTDFTAIKSFARVWLVPLVIVGIGRRHLV